MEEANNSKLRQNVQVRVEDCLQNGQKLSTICRLDQEESNQSKNSTIEEDTQITIPEEQEEEDTTGDSSNASENSVKSAPEEIIEEKVETPIKLEKEEVAISEEKKVEDVPEKEQELPKVEIEETIEERIEDRIEEIIAERIIQEPESEEDDCVIVEEKRSSPIPVKSSSEQKQVGVVAGVSEVVAEGNIVVSVRDDDEGPLSSPYGRMELGEVPGTALLRFPDDRSDSGVSSLRSGSCASGDERSGSRSSALSSSDEPQQQHQQQDSTTNRHDNRILR